jgi:hypothetical protein
MEEAAGGWKRLHPEELHNLNASPAIVRVINQRGRDGWDTCMEEMINAYSILVGRPERKILLGRPRHRW